MLHKDPLLQRMDGLVGLIDHVLDMDDNRKRLSESKEQHKFELLPPLSTYPDTKSNQFSIMSWNILIKELCYVCIIQ